MNDIPNDRFDVCDEWDSFEEKECKVTPPISGKAFGKSRVELSFTGTPESIVGLNVFEYDAVGQGLINEITKERLLAYLTNYEHVPIGGMPTSPMMDETMMEPRDIEDRPTYPDTVTDDNDDHTKFVKDMKQREVKPNTLPPKKHGTPMRLSDTKTPMEVHHMPETEKYKAMNPRELEEEDEVREERFFRNEEEEQVQYRRERLVNRCLVILFSNFDFLFIGLQSSLSHRKNDLWLKLNTSNDACRR